jgi:hypothetical protein
MMGRYCSPNGALLIKWPNLQQHALLGTTMLDQVKQITTVTGRVWHLFKTLLSQTYRVRAREYELQDGKRYLLRGGKINLPAGTNRIVLHGRYLVIPLLEDFAVFVRKDNRYWPQGRGGPHYTDHSTWDCTVTLGNGIHHVIIASVSPEVKVLVDHYWNIGDELDKWPGIVIKTRLAGIRPVQEFEILVG